MNSDKKTQQIFKEKQKFENCEYRGNGPKSSQAFSFLFLILWNNEVINRRILDVGHQWDASENSLYVCSLTCLGFFFSSSLSPFLSLSLRAWLVAAD